MTAFQPKSDVVREPDKIKDDLALVSRRRQVNRSKIHREGLPPKDFNDLAKQIEVDGQLINGYLDELNFVESWKDPGP